MWIYLRAAASHYYKYFIQITLVVSVLFIAISLLLRWGFPPKQSTISSSQIIQTRQAKLLKLFEQPVYKTKEGKQLVAFQKRIHCSLSGSLCTDNSADHTKNFPNSFFGYTSKLLVLPLVKPPASGIAYTHQSIQDSGLVTQAHAAQGVGFASLNPFLGVWKAFRTFSYIILVITVIILGFMIMFQYKIDSHSIISVQNALPRIVIVLLTITFSYAIVGLLIDFMYVLILLMFQIFSKSNLPAMDPGILQDRYLTANLLSIGDVTDPAMGAGGFIKFSFHLYNRVLNSILLLLPTSMQLVISGVLTVVTYFLGIRLASQNIPIAKALFGDVTPSAGAPAIAGISANISSIITAILQLAIAFNIAHIVLMLFFLIVAVIGVLFLYFRILFLLIGAYIQIVINVIFAPIFLLTEVIPGQESFIGWVKKIVGNLLIFPTVIALLLVVQIIQGIGFVGTGNAFSMPLLYDFPTDVLALIISGAMLFVIPDIVKTMVKRIAGDPAIQAGPATLFGAAGIIGGSAMGVVSQIHTLQKMTGGEASVPGLEKLLSALGLVKPKGTKPADH